MEFYGVSPENAHIDFVRVEGVFEIPHVHIILQGIGKLLAVILFDEGGMDEVLVALVEGGGGGPCSLVDRIYDDVQYRPPQEPCPFRLYHEHREVEKSAEVEHAEDGRFGNEICFVTKKLDIGLI